MAKLKLKPEGFKSKRDEKIFRRAWIHGFTEAIRLQNGMPEGIAFETTLRRRRKLAEENFNASKAFTISAAKRYNALAKVDASFPKSEARRTRLFIDRNKKGASPDSKFIKRLARASKISTRLRIAAA